MRGWIGWRWLLAVMVVSGMLAMPAGAAGPIETSIFAMQGVEVDVTAKDAASAKDQALMDVQVKAFFALVTKLGSPVLAESLKEMTPQEIAPYLKSLSIEKESSAPGRYIGTFTVRFLPTKFQALMRQHGVSVPVTQARAVIVLPLWKTTDSLQLWDDNPWRRAWLNLKAEQAMVPLIVPLGDLEDTSTISPEEALNGDPVKIEAIRRRYDAPGIVVAVASPAEGGGIHVVIRGDTDIGKVNFDKVYAGEDGTEAGAIQLAIGRFSGAMTTKFKQNIAKADAKKAANTKSAMSVAVPFASPTEWNRIRSRILATPNVVGVDVSTLSFDGAVVRLTYTNSVERLQTSMQSAGLNMSQIGGTWVIQPL